MQNNPGVLKTLDGVSDACQCRYECLTRTGSANGCRGWRYYEGPDDHSRRRLDEGNGHFHGRCELLSKPMPTYVNEGRGGFMAFEGWRSEYVDPITITAKINGVGPAAGTNILPVTAGEEFSLTIEGLGLPKKEDRNWAAQRIRFVPADAANCGAAD